MAARCCRNLALLLGLLPAALAAHAATAAHWSQPRPHVEHGQASFYAASLHGRRTASGRRFDQRKLTAAHPDLPFGTEVRVTNLENGRSVQVEIIDRGPFTGHRAIDLSRAAAQRIGLTRETGLAPVLIEAIAPWIKGRPLARPAGR
jgi:rare lipoprotein A